MKRGIIVLSVINLVLLLAITLLLYENAKPTDVVISNDMEESVDYVITYLLYGDYEEVEEISGCCLENDCMGELNISYEEIDETQLTLFGRYHKGQTMVVADGKEVVAPSELRIVEKKTDGNILTLNYVDYSRMEIELYFPADQVAVLPNICSFYIMENEERIPATITSISPKVEQGSIAIRVQADVAYLPGTSVDGIYISDIVENVVTLPTKYVASDNTGYYLWTDPENENEKPLKIYYELVRYGEEECIIDISAEYIGRAMRAPDNN